MQSREMSLDKKTINLKDYEIPLNELKSKKIINQFNVLKSQQDNEILFDFKNLSKTQLINSYHPTKPYLFQGYTVLKVYEMQLNKSNKLTQAEQQALIFQLCKTVGQIKNQDKEYCFLILTTFNKQTYFINDYVPNISYQSFSDYFSKLISEQNKDQIIDLNSIQNQECLQNQQTDQIQTYQNNVSQSIISLTGEIKQIINDEKTLKYLKSLTNFKQLYLQKQHQLKQIDLFQSLNDIIILYSNIQFLDFNLQLFVMTHLDLISLGNTIATFQKLQCLKLTMHHIFNQKNLENINEGLYGLYHGISQCKSIIQFNNILSSNNFKSLQIQQIINHISNILSLKKLKLNLNENKINQISQPGIILSISNCQNLEQLTLKLEQNQLSDEQDSLILQFDKLNLLQDLRKLKLDLRGNSIGKKGCQRISEGISQLKKLETLYLELSYNKIGQEGANYLINCLSSYNNLKTLKIFISTNGLSDNNIKLFGEKLQQLSKLQCLKIYLSYNNISINSIKDLIHIINKHQNLKELDFLYSLNEQDVINKNSFKNLLMKIHKLVCLYYCRV